jgi:hypothetical protein
MYLASRVNEYITGRRPDWICDACLARALSVRDQQTNQIAVALGTTSDFDRGDGVCADCGKEQKVIRRV